MKLNAIVLKTLTEKQVKETIALLNHEPFFQGNPIRGKRHANKQVLAEIMVDRVLDAADRGVKIPEDIDILVGKLTDASDILAPVRKPKVDPEIERGFADAQKGATKAATKPKKGSEPSEKILDTLGKNPPKKVIEKAPRKKEKITEDMTIQVVEEKAPKKEGTQAFNLFNLYRKFKTVGNFLEKSGWERPRAALAFDRYHGRIVLK